MDYISGVRGWDIEAAWDGHVGNFDEGESGVVDVLGVLGLEEWCGFGEGAESDGYDVARSEKLREDGRAELAGSSCEEDGGFGCHFDMLKFRN